MRGHEPIEGFGKTTAENGVSEVRQNASAAAVAELVAEGLVGEDPLHGRNETIDFSVFDKKPAVTIKDHFGRPTQHRRRDGGAPCGKGPRKRSGLGYDQRQDR